MRIKNQGETVQGTHLAKIPMLTAVQLAQGVFPCGLKGEQRSEVWEQIAPTDNKACSEGHGMHVTSKAISPTQHPEPDFTLVCVPAGLVCTASSNFGGCEQVSLHSVNGDCSAQSVVRPEISSTV